MVGCMDGRMDGAGLALELTPFASCRAYIGHDEKLALSSAETFIHINVF